MQENGKPQEVEREVRRMLDMMVEDNDKVATVAAMCEQALPVACGLLKILNEKNGDQELVQAAQATLTKLRSYGPPRRPLPTLQEFQQSTLL